MVSQTLEIWGFKISPSTLCAHAAFSRPDIPESGFTYMKKFVKPNMYYILCTTNFLCNICRCIFALWTFIKSYVLQGNVCLFDLSQKIYWYNIYIQKDLYCRAVLYCSRGFFHAFSSSESSVSLVEISPNIRYNLFNNKRKTILAIKYIRKFNWIFTSEKLQWLPFENQQSPIYVVNCHFLRLPDWYLECCHNIALLTHL